MTYPDRLEAAAGRIAAQIRVEAETLAEEAANPRHAECAEYHARAQAGALAYAGLLDKAIAAGRLDDDELRRADLVLTAAGCSGWISAGCGACDRGLAVKELIRLGFFVHHEAVPGQWVECYRLVAPA